MANPLLIALGIAYGAASLGSAIFKGVKGRQLEKQALDDRSMWINVMSSWATSKLDEYGMYKNYIERGVPGGSQMPTVGNLPYSSLRSGQDQVQGQLGGYLSTIGDLGSPPSTGIRTFEDKAMEKKKMAQKLKVKKQTTPRSFGRRSFGGKKKSGTKSSMYL
jgi:hypothetical protein